MSEDPVTLWLDELRNADQVAAAKLWHHFVSRIQGVARKKLRLDSRRVYDEEDVAQSAFYSVCDGIASGRFPDLHDRDCLWRLILVITSRKVAYRHRYDKQQCRDSQRNHDDRVLIESDGVLAASLVDQIVSREPTPEVAAEFVETCDSLFERLNDPTLECVVAMKLEGCNDSEIAERLDCSRRTIQRRLEIIRRHLQALESVSE